MPDSGSNPAGVRPANKRGAARLAAVQALYQMDVAGVGILEVVTEYETYRLGKELDGAQYLEADAQWFRAVVSGVVENQKNIDPVVHGALTDERDVPVAVIVSEYVDIAKAFFDGDEPKLVNAVLDRIARKERPQKT